MSLIIKYKWESMERDRNIALVSCADTNYQASKVLNSDIHATTALKLLSAARV